MNYNLVRFGLILTTFLSIECGRKYPEGLADNPFAVSITITANGVLANQCTGAIVSENYVLTSWACLKTSSETDILAGYVRAGADIIDSDGHIHPIKKIEKSLTGTSDSQFDRNIAMLLVDNFFDFTTYINEVPLNGQDFGLPDEEVNVVGFMSEDEESTKKLHSITTVLMPFPDCFSHLWKTGTHVMNGVVCISLSTNTLLGDLAPGALLLHKRKVVAVLMYKSTVFLKHDEPILFTLIARYVTWINSKTDPHMFNGTFPVRS